MEDHTYRVIELVGTSEVGIDDAVKSAIQRAHRTLRNLRWFEVVRTTGHIDDGAVQHFQVTLKVGFTMEHPSRLARDHSEHDLADQTVQGGSWEG